MIRPVARHLFVLVSATALAACGGGGGGGVGGGGGGPSAPAATFTKTVELPTMGLGWAGPFETGSARFQMLVLASDIGGAGPIQSIAFRLQDAAEANHCPDVTIVLGHTSKASLETTFANNIEEGRGSAAVVLDGAVTIPAGDAGDYVTIPFDEPFLYNGVDNLVVDVISRECSGETTFEASRASTPYTALVWSPNTEGTTGIAATDLAHLKLTFAGGDNTLVYAAGTAVDNTVPFTSGGTRKIQALYLAEEIDGRGPITAVGFPVGNDTSTAQTYTVTVRLAHSTRHALSGTYADAYADTPVTIADEVPFVVPAGLTAGTYVWLPAPDGVFSYNGVDNLVLEVDASTTTGLTRWRMRDPGSGLVRLVSGASGGNVGTGGVAWVPDVKFRFAGGTMDVITPGGADDAVPFGQFDGKRQYLYLASELGSAGTITKIACRLSNLGSVAATYTGYEVTMGHTTATALDTEFAANMVDATLVFSGSVTVPGGLRRGDWIEVPLSTPFRYNGKDNLVVQFAGEAGTVNNRCILHNLSPERYANRRLTGDSQTATSGALFSGLADMRFFVR